jgi:hypothetical protein
MEGKVQMKIVHRTIFGIIIAVALTGSAVAMDMEALDRVSVLMPKSEVRLLIGNPNQYIHVGSLDVELYQLSNMDPLVGTACIYEEKERLAGQIFFFNGKDKNTAVERLIKNGFTLMETKEGSFRLTGKDDDTGQPLMIFIYESNDLTLVMTFENGYYDRKIRQTGKLN